MRWRAKERVGGGSARGERAGASTTGEWATAKQRAGWRERERAGGNGRETYREGGQVGDISKGIFSCSVNRRYRHSTLAATALLPLGIH